MNTQIPQTQKLQPEKLDEYHKLELEQVVEKINTMENLLTQIGSFFGTANLTALGIAFTIQKTGTLLIAPLILIIYLFINASLRRMLLVYYYRAYQLQVKYAPDDEETFIRILPTILAAEARRIAGLKTIQERQAALSKEMINSGRHFWLLLTIFFLEVLTALVIWYSFDWSFF